MQHKRRRILRALARQGGLASPGELYGGLGLAPRTGSRVLGRLRAEGAVSGTKRRVCLTEAGWAAVERGQARPRRSSVARAPRPRRPPPTRRASAPNVAPPADFEQEEASGVSGLGLLLGAGLAGALALLEWRRPAPAVRTRPNAEPPPSPGAPRGGWVMLETGQVRLAPAASVENSRKSDALLDVRPIHPVYVIG